MAICRLLTEVSEKNVERIKIPAGVTLKAGDVVMCEVLDTSDASNIDVYNGAQVADITADVPCIVINQGFEQLPDGRRPEGNPNPADYTFTEGMVITVIRLENDLKFFISNDTLDNVGVVAPAIGVKLIPQATDYQLATSSTIATSITALNIEKLQTQPIGGQFGSAFVAGVIARVVAGR